MADATHSADRAPRGHVTHPADGAVAQAVYAEQVAAVFRQMPLAVTVNLVNGGLTAVVLTPLAARPLPALWFAIVVLVNLGRGALWWRYRRADTGPDLRRWSRWAGLGALAAGLSWGIGGALLFSLLTPLAQLFLTLVIAGMCTGAIVLSALHLPSLLAFTLCASIPVALRFLVQGTLVDTALGAMIGVFAAAMFLGGRHVNRIFVGAMRLRFELDTANRRLQAEIEEHRGTEEALRQAQKLEAIGQLTGGIAHDFNNLLTVVIGSLALADERLGENSAVAPLLAGARQAAERGVALIQRLLGFARRQRLDPRPVDLARMIAGIEGMLARTLGPQIRLVVEAPPDTAPAEVDVSQLELAILNLAVNARDAMPDGGTLRIALACRHVDATAPPGLRGEEYLVIEMTDTGIGMDKATLAQAFDPFFTTKDVGAGTGLGLPTVQGFAIQSGGAVRLSSAPGSGTTVELWLPKSRILPPLADIADDQSVAAAPRGTGQILVCDDDDGLRRLIESYLSSIGYTVHAADRAGAALRLLDAGPPIDLLVVDYAMPGMNGIETWREAQRQRPGLKGLLITGHAAPLQYRAADLAILQKPFSPVELAHRINDILTR